MLVVDEYEIVISRLCDASNIARADDPHVHAERDLTRLEQLFQRVWNRFFTCHAGDFLVPYDIREFVFLLPKSIACCMRVSSCTARSCGQTIATGAWCTP